MADALGYPETPIGYADILRLANDPAGWGAYGHPEWGPFRLGKTNPNFSTSALSSTIAQYYAATGKTSRPVARRPRPARGAGSSRGRRVGVVHYGDITMTFLNNWFRNDVRGTSLTYVSAVAVEEKSVIDYNKGNPDGMLSPGEEPREPRVPLVASTRRKARSTATTRSSCSTRRGSTTRNGTVRAPSRSSSSDPRHKRGCSSSGSAPATSTSRSASRSARSGVSTPNQPQTLLEVPAAGGADRAARPVGRRPQAGPRHDLARRVGIDGRSRRPDDLSETKLDLAKDSGRRRARRVRARRRRRASGSSPPTSGPNQDQDWLDLVPIGPLAGQRETIARERQRPDRPSTGRRSTPRRRTRTTTCSRASTRRASTQSCC